MVSLIQEHKGIAIAGAVYVLIVFLIIANSYRVWSSCSDDNPSDEARKTKALKQAQIAPVFLPYMVVCGIYFALEAIGGVFKVLFSKQLNFCKDVFYIRNNLFIDSLVISFVVCFYFILFWLIPKILEHKWLLFM